jgi:hypothetical protein
MEIAPGSFQIAPGEMEGGERLGGQSAQRRGVGRVLAAGDGRCHAEAVALLGG